MKKNLRHLLLALCALAATACSDDKTQTAILPETLLSTSEVVLDPAATKSVRITVTPDDADIAPEDFTLTDAAGAAPAHVRMQSVVRSGEGLYEMKIRDLRSADAVGGKYVEELQVNCTAAGGRIAPMPLTVRNTPYMPIVRITTQTPQEQITKETWVAGRISIDGGGAFDDLEEMDTEVKGRGNSTWGWEKKPYALKLAKKNEVLGMPKHKRWCLIANYMDRTHLRNRIAYHIGRNSKLAYTVRNEYAELYFNGAYYGLFLLTEQIKVDENRVDIVEMEPGDNAGEALTGGYLLEFDTNYDEDCKFRSQSTYIPVNIKSPDPEEMTAERLDYIQSYVNTLDAAIAAAGKGQTATDPFQWLDRESMIDYWICFEVMANHEILHPKSIYFHKDRGGKLVAGPIWDFDYETLVAHTQTQWINYGLFYQYNEFPWYADNWWNLLMNDASFRADIKRRWQEWYPFLKEIPAFIERERAAIAAAERRNFARWPNIDTGHPNRDEKLSFDEAVDLLASVYATRVAWMNENIANW